MPEPARAACRAVQQLQARPFLPAPQAMDRNGHMNVGQYGLVFDDAWTAVAAALGLAGRDAGTSGCKALTHACVFTHRREVLAGQPLRLAWSLQSVTADALRWSLQLQQDAAQAVAATCDAEARCVSTATGAPRPWPAPVLQALQALRALPSGALALPAPRRGPPGPPDSADHGDAGDAGDDGAALAARLAAIDFSDMVVLPPWTDAQGELPLPRLGPCVNEAMRRLAWGGLGMGAVTAASLGQTAFVLESRLRGHRTLRRGDPLAFTYRLLDVDDKRSRATLVVRHGTEGWTAAVVEQLAICVDVATRRATAWHPATRSRLQALRRAQAQRLPTP